MFPFPVGYNFGKIFLPGFFVSYKATNDFYFSGHAGGTLLILKAFLRSKNYKLITLGILTFTITLYSLLILRMHYTNDIIIGILISNTIDNLIYKNKYTL